MPKAGYQSLTFRTENDSSLPPALLDRNITPIIPPHLKLQMAFCGKWCDSINDRLYVRGEVWHIV